MNVGVPAIQWIQRKRKGWKRDFGEGRGIWSKKREERTPTCEARPRGVSGGRSCQIQGRPWDERDPSGVLKELPSHLGHVPYVSVERRRKEGRKGARWEGR